MIPSEAIRRARRQRARRDVRRIALVVSAAAAAAGTALLYRAWTRGRPAPPRPLAVVARGASGEALAGVRVRFFEKHRVHLAAVFEARTGADGTAVLPAERAAGDFYCVGRREDGIVSQTWVSQSTPAAKPALEFVTPGKVRGTVFGAAGLPVAGAHVEACLAGGPPLETAATRDDGSFELAAISTSLPFLTIRVRHPGYADDEQEWDRKVGDPLQFELVETQVLRVRVVDPTGRPLPGLSVEVKGRSDLATTTDDHGLVRFPGIHPDDRLFLTLPSGALTFRNDGFRPQPRPHELRLEPAATVAGRVLDLAGDGVAGVEVRHRHGPRAWVRAQTDRHGRFDIGDLPAGRTELFWELPDGATGSTLVDVAPGEARRGFVIRIR